MSCHFSCSLALIESRGIIARVQSAVLNGASGPSKIKREPSFGGTGTPIYDHAARVSYQDTVDGRQVQWQQQCWLAGSASCVGSCARERVRSESSLWLLSPPGELKPPAGPCAERVRLWSLLSCVVSSPGPGMRLVGNSPCNAMPSIISDAVRRAKVLTRKCAL
jgi:hypothetical protein